MKIVLILTFHLKLLLQEILVILYLYYITILKNIGVGKTNLLTQGIKSASKELEKKNYSATVGFEFYPFIIKIQDTILKLNICKPNDDEKYRSLINNYYKDCSLAILLYSIDE